MESARVSSIENQKRAKPFLRWAGSKRKQLARLGSFWSPLHARYVEPFAGSACLFFDLAPSVAILGDNNCALIDLYRVVRDEPERVYRRLCRIRRDSDTYYRWRKKKPNALDPESRAVRFLYLNRNCFNGIFRTNVKGEFNVPIGVRPGEYFSKEDLILCASLLKRAKLVAGDFAKTLEHVKAGDFVYLDPPFALQSRRMFRHYGVRSFQTTDVPRLADALRTIVAAGADFLVSYADCAEARGLARRWNAIRLPIARHVGGFADRRRRAYEWLITNMTLPALD
ncbi:MAG: Dam family site-specific DNA-(adenine-N6)-methyltransferase [Planctomycetes bacterium]|nr:Dam family site-specific DNA-(adenine-N6)-methyltransferase [Planctomycetota bacterium]